MPKSDYEVLPSTKVGLDVFEESYVVVRKGIAYLRVVGREPSWELMTATADEDHGRILVCRDRSRLAEAATKLCEHIGVEHEVATDRGGRRYTQICSITRLPGETDYDFDETNVFLFNKFFEIYDSLGDSTNASGSSASNLYRDLGVVDGEDVYLSDGVWLRPDGSLDDRGR